MICPSCSNEIPDGSKFCSFCGASFEYTPRVVSEPQSSNKKSAGFPAVVAIILVVLIVLSGALNVYQYVTLQKKNIEIVDLNNDILDRDVINSILENNNSKQASEIDALKKAAETDKKTIQSQKTKVDILDKIIQTAQYAKLSSTSSHFYVDRYVVCMKRNSTQSIKLTANWSAGGTVYADESAPSIAYVTFDDNSWYNSVNMTIHSGSTLGISVVSFRNSIDAIAFDVMVIVYE